ncbi:MAG: acc operon protein [Candidatus Sericytochromatia bacterium]|nr:acc operon protein [Candidatus Sericytochromatia bacterium]
MELAIDRAATSEEAAAIAAVVETLLAAEVAAAPPPARELRGWAVAARVEALGLVRRVPGILDLRYMSAPTRERLTRAR